MFALLLLPLSACAPWEANIVSSCRDCGVVEETGGDTASSARFPVFGQRAGEAFGSSLAASDSGQVFVGAPWGGPGRVYSVDESSVVYEEPGSGALGRDIVVDAAGDLYAGAPLSGDGAGGVWGPDGEQRGREGELMGAALGLLDGELVISVGAGASINGEELPLPHRPSAFAQAANEWVVGYARGPVAVAVGEHQVPRLMAADEAGTSLCSGVDADGAVLVLAGAPGANAVLVIDVARLPDAEALSWVQGPSGRFGQAVACGEDALWVGGPLHGDALGGAVWQVPYADLGASIAAPPPLRLGEDGQQLGEALLVSPDRVLVGAPGTGQGRGAVLEIEL